MFEAQCVVQTLSKLAAELPGGDEKQVTINEYSCKPVIVKPNCISNHFTDIDVPACSSFFKQICKSSANL